MAPDLPYWEASQAARARLQRGDGGPWRLTKRQAPQRISARSSSRTITMTDQQAALSGLPLPLRNDVALTLATATALGGAPGHPREMHAAAVLVTAYRAREAGSRG